MTNRLLTRVAFLCIGLFPAPTPMLPSASTTAHGAETSARLSFFVAGDMRNFVTNAPEGKRYFDGACEAMKPIGGQFLITPGDGDPPAPIRAAIDQHLGKDFPWYPVVGNHEYGQDANIEWLDHWARAGIPHVVRLGPAERELTMYSFDFGNSHFVAMDDYPDTKALSKTDITDATFAWLEKDLAANRQPIVWVIGHTPIKSQPDMDGGRVRHEAQSISADPERVGRFVALLKKHHVRAYICGHTHNASVVQVDGVWQLDSGHARGGGDTGSASTFLNIRTEGTGAWVDIYRADINGLNYTKRKTVRLE
jgi:hypothetical protein